MLDFQGDIEQQLAERYIVLEHLEEKLELIKKQIAQTQDELQLNQAMFQHQLVPQVTVITAETALLQLQLALSEAQHDQTFGRI